jgi:hypothetical protein
VRPPYNAWHIFPTCSPPPADVFLLGVRTPWDRYIIVSSIQFREKPHTSGHGRRSGDVDAARYTRLSSAAPKLFVKDVVLPSSLCGIEAKSFSGCPVLERVAQRDFHL